MVLRPKPLVAKGARGSVGELVGDGLIGTESAGWCD